MIRHLTRKSSCPWGRPVQFQGLYVLSLRGAVQHLRVSLDDPSGQRGDQVPKRRWALLTVVQLLGSTVPSWELRGCLTPERGGTRF